MAQKFSESPTGTFKKFGPKLGKNEGPNQPPEREFTGWTLGAALLRKFGAGGQFSGAKFSGGRAGYEEDSEGESEEETSGENFAIRQISESPGARGGFCKTRGSLAKIAEAESSKTVTVPHWDGDMFSWTEFARGFCAFRTASEAQGAGFGQGPDFWTRALVSRWGGAAEPDRELILRQLDEDPAHIAFEEIIRLMDERYAARVSAEALEKRWSSFPLQGPEDHHLISWYTKWVDLAKGFQPSGATFRRVFLALCKEHHSRFLFPPPGLGGHGTTLLEVEAAGGKPFSAGECYNFLLERLETQRKVSQAAAIVRGEVSGPSIFQHPPHAVFEVAATPVATDNEKWVVPHAPPCIAPDQIADIGRQLTYLRCSVNQIGSAEHSGAGFQNTHNTHNIYHTKGGDRGKGGPANYPNNRYNNNNNQERNQYNNQYNNQHNNQYNNNENFKDQKGGGAKGYAGKGTMGRGIAPPPNSSAPNRRPGTNQIRVDGALMCLEWGMGAKCPNNPCPHGHPEGKFSCLTAVPGPNQTAAQTNLPAPSPNSPNPTPTPIPPQGKGKAY